MEKVVKCNGCGQYFMRTEKDIKCPFCNIEYSKVEVEEKTSAPAQGGQANGSASGGKDEKVAAKTQKKSFKIWKDN